MRLLLAVLLASLAGLGQELAIKPSLHMGDVFAIESLRAHEDSQRPQSNRRTKTRIDFKVDEADAQSGFLLDVVVGESDVLEPAGGLNPLVEKLGKAAAAIHYKVRLGPGGDYKGVENQNEVGRQLVGILNELKTAILAELPEAQREATDRAMRASLQPSVIIASALEDVTMFFKLEGGAIPTNRPVVASVLQPIPSNNVSIPGDMRIEVAQSDANFATIKIQTQPTSEALATLKAQLLSQMSPEVAANAPPMTVQVQDDGTYQLDLATGLMTHVDFTRKLEVASLIRKDTWQLKLVTPPSR